MVEARVLPDCESHLLSLEWGAVANVPATFVHDKSESVLGSGKEVFRTATDAMRSWAEFDLGWACVHDPTTAIVAGKLVAVLARTLGLWSLNISRITETLDTATQFGFVYSTTPLHVEHGEERFLIEMDEDRETVTYRIEAFSMPRHPLARLGYPFTRAMQRRFARDSHERMKRSVYRAR